MKTLTVTVIVVLVMAAFAAGIITQKVWQGSVVSLPPAGEKQLWTCGMHPQVIQDHPGNCPICHMDLVPLKQTSATKPVASDERKVKYWYDPMMNPPYIADRPGKSPMGMDLVPVYED